MRAALVMQPLDVLYLAGTAQPCNLLVAPGRPPVLLARRFGALVREQTWVEHVVDGAGLGAVARELERLDLGPGPVGLELDVVPAALYRKVASAFADREVVDCSPALLGVRMGKDAGEVAALRDAAGLFDAVHGAIAATVAPGVAEHEVAGEILRALRRAGHEGVIAQRRWDAALHPDGALVSGENLSTFSGGPVSITGVGMSRAVPYGASRRRIADGDLVNIDVGLNRAGYHADIARTYVLGAPSALLAGLAAAVRACQDACLAAIRPGATAGAVYEAGRDAAERLGVADVFQGYDGVHGPYVGHGLGLELDEPPVLGPGDITPLREGMVLAVEPKLISPAFGAVNIEDDVVVTADGCELLGDLARTVFVLDGRGGVAPLDPG